MANLQTLRDDVRDTLSETAGNLTDSSIDRLIRMATAKLQRDLVANGAVKPRQMLAFVTLTTDSNGILTLPDDWLRARSVKSGDTLYKYVSGEKLTDRGQLTDSDVDINYYQKIPALTEATSNWLLDDAEDLYIYATCLQYAPWAKENGTVYENFYDDGLVSVGESNSAQPTGGMIQQKRARYNGFYSIYGNSMVFGRI